MFKITQLLEALPGALWRSDPAGVYRRQEQDDERRVFELADSALYQAKQNGRARAVIYADEFAMH